MCQRTYALVVFVQNPFGDVNQPARNGKLVFEAGDPVFPFECITLLFKGGL